MTSASDLDQHLASFPRTAAGSRALAGHLRDDHGEQAVHVSPGGDHAACSAVHAAAHEKEAAARLAITQDEANGRVLVPVTSLAGEATYAIGADSAEHIRVTPVDAFAYQGRRYSGTIMLNRARFHPDRQFYKWLTSADAGFSADAPAFDAISAAVSWAVEAHVSAHPEVTAAGNRAAARFRARQVARQITEAEEHLEALRAEHAKLLKAAGEEP